MSNCSCGMGSSYDDDGMLTLNDIRRREDVDVDATNEVHATVEALREAMREAKPKFEFQAWPKTYRQYRTICVTEKLDGSNAAIQFSSDGDIAAQSRKRLIEPGNDNFGFAAFAYANKEKLFEVLGPGIHFGEWYGRSIQRTYGLDHRRFALFNVDKWQSVLAEPLVFDDGTQLTTPPVLYRGIFSDEEIRDARKSLYNNGSAAAPGFMNPEGVCIWHSQTRQVTKFTLDDNDDNKWMHETS